MVRPEIFTYDKSFAICEASIFISLDICVEETKRFASLLQQLDIRQVPSSLRKVGSGTSYNLSAVSFGSRPFLLFIQVIRLTKIRFFFGIARMIHTISTQVLFSRKRDNGMLTETPAERYFKLSKPRKTPNRASFMNPME